MNAGQVLTPSEARSFDEGALDQSLTPLADIAGSVLATLLVSRPTVPPSQPIDAARQRSGVDWPSATESVWQPKPIPRSRLRAECKQGGWPSSTGLRWGDVKAIYELAHQAGRAGYRLNHLVSIMPESGDDMERKRSCARIVGHLGQALKRHGRPHIGVTVYEKDGCADLHAHHLVHIPKSEKKLLAHLSERREIHIRRAASTDVGYVTKQRLPLSPDFETRISHWRKKGARIPGKRWTATAAALALSAVDAARTPQA